MSSTDRFFEELLSSTKEAAKREVAAEITKLRAQARSVPKLKAKLTKLKAERALFKQEILKETQVKLKKSKDASFC